MVESESADGLVTQPQTFILREHTNEKIKAHAHKREIEPPYQTQSTNQRSTKIFDAEKHSK